MNQLTIFDAMVQFDENRANWKNVLNEFDRCFVLAIIPENVLSSVEQWHRKERQDRELWSNYAVAVWGYVTQFENIPYEDSWSFACKRLSEYRDAKKPCPMEVTRPRGFYPEHVVEYL